MNLTLILFLLFVALFAFVAKIATSSKENRMYTDINTDEWNCSSCGFLVQVGDQCISVSYTHLTLPTKRIV